MYDKLRTLMFPTGSRKNMVRSVEGSLKRLKTDRIDLYWAGHDSSDYGQGLEKVRFHRRLGIRPVHRRHAS